MNLADLIVRNAAFGPEKVALRFEGAALTYRALAERIDRVAHGLLSAGIRRGDRVAVLAANHPDTLVLLYACARAGAMLVPLNWRLAGPEIAWILADADPALLVLDRDFADLLPATRDTLPDLPIVELGPAFETLAIAPHAGDEPEGDLQDPLLLVYTSGTTGRPKGAILRQEALVWNAAMSQHMHGLTAEDHVLTVLPFFHVGGLNIQTTPALQAGATVTIHRRFAPEPVCGRSARNGRP